VRFFFAHPVFPSVHARSARVGTGERESGRDRGQQLVVRGLLRSPTGKLDMRVARIPPIGAWSRYLKGTSAHVALELTHVEPVDQRSGTRKADGVWHFWERPGQRHDALRRVAQPPECRLLFTVHMQHVPSPFSEARSYKVSKPLPVKKKHGRRRDYRTCNDTICWHCLHQLYSQLPQK